MNIRKFFRFSFVTIASLFWASCGGDSDSSTGVNGADAGMEPESSSDALLQTSSSAEPNSSDAVPESSLSDTLEQNSSDAASSSSDQIESSSSAKKYIMASDSSVTCAKEKSTYSTCSNNSSSLRDYSCMELQEFLKKDTTITEKILQAWESELETCAAITVPVAVYGVFYDPCAGAPTYTEVIMRCSDGFIYHDYKVEGDLLYKNTAEYNAAHGISSSSAAESSSSQPEDLVQNCPHDEFALFADILADVQGALYEKIVKNLEENAELSEAQKTYLEGILDRENKTLKGDFAPYLEGDFPIEETTLDDFGPDGASSANWFSGYIAKTKTCADGSPETTESYKAKYDAIYEEALELLNSRLANVK